MRPQASGAGAGVTGRPAGPAPAAPPRSRWASSGAWGGCSPTRAAGRRGGTPPAAAAAHPLEGSRRPAPAQQGRTGGGASTSCAGAHVAAAGAAAVQARLTHHGGVAVGAGGGMCRGACLGQDDRGGTLAGVRVPASIHQVNCSGGTAETRGTDVQGLGGSSRGHYCGWHRGWRRLTTHGRRRRVLEQRRRHLLMIPSE
jgi:hypothetical protein